MRTPPRVSHVSSAPPPRRVSWLSAAILFGPLALAAEGLFRTTHHRPLGAVTLAAATIVLWVLSELLLRRGLADDASLESLSLEVGGDGGSARRRVARFVLGTLGFAASILCLFRAFLAD